MKISIIGSAGRNEDANTLSVEIFNKMYIACKNFIIDVINLNQLSFSDIELVSGGSAWSDHLAVLLFLEYHTKGLLLTLHLPTNFKNTEFEYDRYGYTLNQLHQEFSKKCNIDSFSQIYQSITQGANINVYKGFFERNKYVAKTDILLAFTFGKNGPKPGGTKDTWNKCPSQNKIHICISDL